MFLLLGMVFSRELCRAASSLVVYVSLFHLYFLHLVDSKCPRQFRCGNLSNLEYPLASSSQPGCGLLTVECGDGPNPKIHLDNNYWPSAPYDILERISINQVLIRNQFLQSLPKINSDKRCHLFLQINVSMPYTPFISISFFPNITLFKCNKDSEIPNIQENYRKHADCELFDIYYPKSNKSLPPPKDCSVLQLPRNLRDNPDSLDLFKRLGAEFHLEWNVSSDCHNCLGNGGNCTTNAKNEFRCDKDKRNFKKILAAGVLAAVIVLFSVILFTYKRRKYLLNLKAKRQNHEKIELFLKNNENLKLRRYNYSDLKRMTNSFSDNLGEGGFASVYKGKLTDGRLVAVKILKELKGNGEEFINEIASISRTSHINVVTLLGFCFEGSKSALIYEFMPNGSLEKFICSNTSIAERQLGWEKLFQISIGIAKGIEYLHQGCNTRILHFDIKPHNILLDKDYIPKISDFGLAKLCPNRSSIVSKLGARGTIGYIAPEIVYRNVGDISYKSDVYSYGMMVLEMVGETKNTNVRGDHSSEKYFPDWIYEHLEQNSVLDFNRVANEDELLKIRKMVIVGLWCIQTDPTTRPSMSRVIEMLEGNIESLQIPPKPYFLSLRAAENFSTTESSVTLS